MPHLSIALLGPARVTLHGDIEPTFSYAKVRALLAYLAVENQHAHPRDTLTELLWPEQPAQTGRGSLRRALAALRLAIADQSAEPALLLATRETVQFNPRGDYILDTARFAELIQACTRHSHVAPARCEACVERWEQAVQLYRGPFLDSAVPRGCHDFEAWALAQRAWFERHTLDALANLADHFQGCDAHNRALLYTRWQLDIDPWRETAHRQAMLLLADLGQRGAALAQYERCRRVLAQELGVEPEAETVELCERIRTGEIRRRADLEPGKAEAAKSTSLVISTAPLPAQPTSFVGRETELAELLELLTAPDCRMLTLLGPGGIGKTRLALRLAERSGAKFQHGVAWVPLAALDSVAALVETIATVLGCKLDQRSDPLSQLREFVRPRELLLLLDNFEHLLPGVDLLADLLGHAPGLKIVITSRERLQSQWEWLYDLVGLSCTGTEAGELSAAMQLFLERARRFRRTPALSSEEQRALARIVQAVEGMPLALELAAAASRQRSYAAIADAIGQNLDLLQTSLRDTPDRHHSMHAALEHSWHLLTSAEQHVLARLSVFRGGFELAAAAQVAHADEAMLAALIDKSLLRQVDGRYELHELIRQFAAAQLGVLGATEATATAHLTFFAELAEAAEPQLLGAEQATWLACLEREHANVRAGLRWGLDQRQSEPAARLAGALWRFWWMHGHLSEGRRWLDEVLEQGASFGEAVRFKVAKAAGSLANQQSDYECAYAHHGLALALAEQLGDTFGIANVLSSLARVANNLGDQARAQALMERGLAIHQELGNERGIALALDGLAELAHTQGAYERARQLYEQSLALHHKRGDQHSIALVQHNLNDMARLQGDYVTALGERENMERFRALGNLLGVAAAQYLLGGVAEAQNDTAAARHHYSEAIVLLRDGGYVKPLALCLASFAVLAAKEGRWATAARRYSAALAQHAGFAAALAPADRQSYEQTLAAIRAALEERALAVAWAEGQSLDINAVVDEVLADP